MPVLLFRATPRSLGFVTTWSAVSGFNGGLRFVQVFVADADSGSDTPGRRLLLNERPLPPEERLQGAVIRDVVRTEGNRYLAELAPPRAGGTGGGGRASRGRRDPKRKAQGRTRRAALMRPQEDGSTAETSS